MYLSFFPATLLQSLNQVNTKFTEVRQEQLLQTLIVLAKKTHFSLIIDCKSQFHIEINTKESKILRIGNI